MGILKKAWRATPASHLLRDGPKGMLKQYVKQGKAAVDPLEIFKKEKLPPGEARKKAKDKIARMKGPMSSGMKAGGKTSHNRRRRDARRAGSSVQKYAGGGICRGGGAATRGMKYGKDG